MHGLEMERLAMEVGGFAVALKFPREDRGVILVVAQRFAIRGLMFLAEMRSGRFIAIEGVRAHQLGEFEEIGNASRAFQGLVKIFAVSRDAHVAPELFAQFGNFSERLAQSFFAARHSAFVPEEQTELAME